GLAAGTCREDRFRCSGLLQIRAQFAGVLCAREGGLRGDGWIKLQELLLLEDVVKSAPSAFRARGPRRCLVLHRDVQQKERARIASALVGAARRHRLGALKTVARIEVGALPAGVEF